MQITNKHELSLPMAVWLLHDDYDYVNDMNYVSATGLLKSTKQILLNKRVPAESREADVSDFLSSRFGNAIHDAMEKAWKVSGQRALRMLGYPPAVYENIVINPRDQDYEINPDLIAIHIEVRAKKEITIDGVVWTIGGKFDQVMDGRLFDTKSTSVWTYLKRSKDDDYGVQGGIYKWLNPDIITSDHVFIQFFFTDWQRSMSRTIEGYPQVRALEMPVALPSMEEIEGFIVSKIRELSRYKDAPEEQMPPCTDKELWRSEPSYRYFTDPEKAKDPNAKSTKNFASKLEAEQHRAEKGKGVIVVKMGEPKACEYCPAFAICKQKDQYFAEGN